MPFSKTYLIVLFLIIPCRADKVVVHPPQSDVLWDKVDDITIEFNNYINPFSNNNNNNPLDGWWPFGETTVAPRDEDESDPCEINCKCGIPNTNTRVIGGHETQVNEYPWIGLMLIGANRVLCGSSLINDRYVLTAAHCIDGFNISQLSITFLEHTRSNTNETTRIKTNIQSALVHPNYNRSTHDNDIAIVRLDRVLKFNDQLRPVCLPLPRLTYRNVTAIVMGWGRLSPLGGNADSLQELSVRVYPPGECKMSPTAEYFGTITDNMLCAGGELNKDACEGDSGGPLVYRRRFRYLLIGLVSFGVDCGEPDYPGIYVRANRYLSWIRSNTEDGCYCDEGP